MLARAMVSLCVSSLVLLASASARPQLSFDLPAVDPFELHSPAATWSLSVDPSSPQGTGPATYRLSRGADIQWTKDLPCTLRGGRLGDDGAFAGWATADDAGLRLMLVGSDGKVRFDAALAHEADDDSGTSYPNLRDVLVDVEHDRVLFRVGHSDASGSSEEWRAVRESTGESLSSVRPSPPFDASQAFCALGTVKPVVGLPLLACGWVVVSGEDSPRGAGRGARFLVTDYDAKPVLGLDLPHDYEAGGDDARSNRLLRWAYAAGASIESNAPQRIDIVLAADAQRAGFELSADATAETGWAGRPLGSESHTIELDEKPAPAVATSASTELRFELVGEVELQVGDQALPTIGAFDIDDRGRMGHIQIGMDAVAHFVLVDSQGAPVSDIALETQRQDALTPTQVLWTRGDRWLVLSLTFGRDSHVLAWWLDLPAGTLTELPGIEASVFEQVDGTFDGGFVALVPNPAGGAAGTTLSSFDAAGKLRWSTVVADVDPASGRSFIKDVCVSPRGEIGVLGSSKHAIQRFDLDGKPLGTLELDRIAGRALNFPSELGVTPQGNWIVGDFQGSPPVLRVSHDGQLLGTLTPHFVDGRTFARRGEIRGGPNERLWTTDGYALLRLDDEGVVDSIVGHEPDATSFSQVEWSSLDASGRALLADEHTHAVHVFDRGGKRVATCTFAPGETNEQSTVQCMSVSSDGNIHVGLSDSKAARTFAFKPLGGRLGKESFPGTSYFAPGKAMRWTVAYGALELFDASGASKKKITRCPDQRWLGNVAFASVAPDGSMAVVSRGKLHVFAADGSPVASHELPRVFDTPNPFSEYEFSSMAFDGAHVFFGYGVNLWSLDLATRAVRMTALGGGGKLLYVSELAWLPDSQELCVLDDQDMLVMRYRLAP